MQNYPVGNELSRLDPQMRPSNLTRAFFTLRACVTAIYKLSARSVNMQASNC